MEHILEALTVTKENIEKFLGPTTNNQQTIDLKILIGAQKVYIAETWPKHSCQKDGSCADHLLIIKKKEEFMTLFKIKA